MNLVVWPVALLLVGIVVVVVVFGIVATISRSENPGRTVSRWLLGLGGLVLLPILLLVMSYRISYEQSARQEAQLRVKADRTAMVERESRSRATGVEDRGPAPAVTETREIGDSGDAAVVEAPGSVSTDSGGEPSSVTVSGGRARPAQSDAGGPPGTQVHEAPVVVVHQAVGVRWFALLLIGVVALLGVVGWRHSPGARKAVLSIGGGVLLLGGLMFLTHHLRGSLHDAAFQERASSTASPGSPDWRHDDALPARLVWSHGEPTVVSDVDAWKAADVLGFEHDPGRYGYRVKRGDQQNELPEWVETSLTKVHEIQKAGDTVFACFPRVQEGSQEWMVGFSGPYADRFAAEREAQEAAERKVVALALKHLKERQPGRDVARLESLARTVVSRQRRYGSHRSPPVFRQRSVDGEPRVYRAAVAIDARQDRVESYSNMIDAYGRGRRQGAQLALLVGMAAAMAAFVGFLLWVFVRARSAGRWAWTLRAVSGGMLVVVVISIAYSTWKLIATGSA